MSTPNGTTSNALVVADVAHVVWAVNIGCLGLHLWPYRAADPEHADELRIDLDPTTGIGFDEVRGAALRCRDLLVELGLRGYPKTTGSNGLHVYVRLEPRWDSIEVRAAAVALARELERRHPEEITANWWKEERGTRVFVDFNQNAPHKTVFGAWFARPRVGGQVSTPLSWEEVETVVADELTIRSVPDLVRRRGDPWADIADVPQLIDPLLAMAERTGMQVCTMRRGRRSTPRCPTSRPGWHRAGPKGEERHDGRELRSWSRSMPSTRSRSDSSAAGRTPTRSVPSATLPGRSPTSRPRTSRSSPDRDGCSAWRGWASPRRRSSPRRCGGGARLPLEARRPRARLRPRARRRRRPRCCSSRCAATATRTRTGPTAAAPSPRWPRRPGVSVASISSSPITAPA